jgi:hypothetical protein
LLHPCPSFTSQEPPLPIAHCRELTPLCLSPAPAALLLASSAPALASVDFANLKSGVAVTSPVHIDMAVKGLKVLPASE